MTEVWGDDDARPIGPGPSWRSPDAADFETFIRVYPRILDAQTCQAIIDAFERDRDGHRDGQVVGGFHPEVKKTTDLQVVARAAERLDIWGDLPEKIHEAMTKTRTRYMAETPGACWVRGPIQDTGYQIQRYRDGQGQYLTHVDTDGPATAHRFAACILYLNDIPHGGGTSFPTWRVRIKPRTGSVAWFPAGFAHVHQGEIPLGAHKYVVTSFAAFAVLRYLKSEGR